MSLAFEQTFLYHITSYKTDGHLTYALIKYGPFALSCVYKM